MLNIFLDTQVYQSKNFNFSDKAILRLEKFVEIEIVELHTTSITNNEIENHIKQKIEDSREHIKKFRKNAQILNNYDLYRPIWDRKVIEQAEIKLLQDFSEFLDSNNVNEIPISGEYTKQIFNHYFEKTPPFSSKKKSEFPDAFVIYSLLEWADTNNKELYVVSGDNDFKNFCESKSNIKHINSLESALDLINQNDEVIYDLAQKLYDDQLGEFLEYINESINKGTAELNIDAFDVVDVEVKELFVESEDDLSADPLVLDLEEDQITIVLNAVFNFKIKTNSIDQTRSPFDYEIGEYLYEEYEEKEYSDIARLPVELELDVEDLVHQDYAIKSIKINNGAVYYYVPEDY